MGKSKQSTKYAFAVLPVVVALVALVMGMLSHLLLSYAGNTAVGRTEACARLLESWASQVTGELEIYRRTIDRYFQEDERLKEYMESTYQLSAIYPQGIYIGGDDNFFLSADAWDPGEGYDVMSRPWYAQARYSTEFVFGEPYLDLTLNKVCVSISGRMEYDKSVRVMAADVYDDYSQQVIADLCSEGGFDDAFIVTGGGKSFVADSGGAETGSSLADADRALYREIGDLLEDGKTGSFDLKEDGDTCRVTVTHVETPDWYLVSCVGAGSLWEPVRRMVPAVIAMAAAAGLLLIFFAIYNSRKAVEAENFADTDRLTGILNRETFQTIVTENAGTLKPPGMLILFDLDHFKSINDNLGHPEGDRVLIAFAALLKEFFQRSAVYAGRLGGDEFAVFIGREITPEAAGLMLDRFMARAREQFDPVYGKYGLSASAGAAYGSDYETLYKKADGYLYRAKQGGRNRHCVEGLEEAGADA